MSDRGYKNTIYLKNGSTITNENAENLSEVMRYEDDWESGSILLKSDSAHTVIPKYYIASINSELEDAE